MAKALPFPADFQGRDIVFQASWPDYVEDQDHATAGTLPNNTDLWYKVGTQAHEFRSNQPWAGCTDILMTPSPVCH